MALRFTAERLFCFCSLAVVLNGLAARVLGIARRVKVQTIDRKVRYVFRQSGLNEFLLCPERARAQWYGECEDLTSAEAAIGTATHLAIERLKDPEGPLTPSEALEAAIEAFRGLTEEPDFRWAKIKTANTAEQHIVNCFNTWLRDIEPLTSTPLAIEQSFSFKLDAWDKYEIWLEGMVDFIDLSGVWDWKTCSDLRKYTSEGWMLKRWAIQPTVYTLAALALGFYGDVDAAAPNGVPFTYGAMQRTPPKAALLTLERGPAHWNFLKDLCWRIVELDQANLSRWPTNNQHALCSDLWCPNWDNCGAKYQVAGAA